MSMSLMKDTSPNQIVTFVFSQDQDKSIALEERYEIKKCVDWIKNNNYLKVCLQFPESYLSDSVDVALLIEEQLSEKTYILGDTSFGSCCIDEIGAKHVRGDAVIHFGHACLTQNLSLPVLHVLPKRTIDLSFIKNVNTLDIHGTSIVIYDVGYAHIADEIQTCFSKEYLYLPELLVNDEHVQKCCDGCMMTANGKHSEVRFSRGFCIQNKAPDNFIYFGEESDPLFTNFACLFKESQAWIFSGNSLVRTNTFKLFKQISFYTEEIKAAESLTVVVVSLSVPRVLDAIGYVKILAKRWNKKVYIISLGKPNIAKLANFPEADVFVVLGCPETHLINNKDIIQPVVGLMEVELALNENRTWNDIFSKDFRDLLPDGQDYIPLPEDPPENASYVSNITGRLSGQTMTGDSNSTDITMNLDKSLASSLAKTGGKRERTWFGLDQSLGTTPVTLAVPGRTGTSTGYDDEPNE